ncbi:MAG: hypothetical protein R2710_18885 [Acidimicrobiales bacterium]
MSPPSSPAPVPRRCSGTIDRSALAAMLVVGAAASSLESVDLMVEAGLWRVLTPASVGGAEAGLRALVDSLFVVGAADPAAGWVQMVSNARTWMVGNFPAECRGGCSPMGPTFGCRARWPRRARPPGWTVGGGSTVAGSSLRASIMASG